MNTGVDANDIKGHLILLMAPTGSGKGELERHIFAKFPELVFSVSCTTRPPRPGEVDGRDYYFLTTAEFKSKIEAGEFLEWAEFSGNLYGTLKSELLDALKAGKIVLNEIELQGVESTKQLIPLQNLSVIYIDAGGWDSLERRAKLRAPITEEELNKRRERFVIESGFKPHADYVISNLDGALEEAKLAFETLVSDIIKKVKSKQ